MFYCSTGLKLVLSLKINQLPEGNPACNLLFTTLIVPVYVMLRILHIQRHLCSESDQRNKQHLPSVLPRSSWPSCFVPTSR